MKITYYILLIGTNRRFVEPAIFSYILEDFKTVFAIYEGGRCKALCEDDQILTMFNTYQENNGLAYNTVHIIKEGHLLSLINEVHN